MQYFKLATPELQGSVYAKFFATGNFYKHFYEPGKVFCGYKYHECDTKVRTYLIAREKKYSWFNIQDAIYVRTPKDICCNGFVILSKEDVKEIEIDNYLKTTEF